MKVQRSIPFWSDSNYIIIEDTMGTQEALFKARLRESIGFGSGDTHLEAARSLIDSVRRAADDMECALNKWKESHCEKCGSSDAGRYKVKDFGMLTSDVLRCNDCGHWTNMMRQEIFGNKDKSRFPPSDKEAHRRFRFQSKNALSFLTEADILKEAEEKDLLLHKASCSMSGGL